MEAFLEFPAAVAVATLFAGGFLGWLVARLFGPAAPPADSTQDREANASRSPGPVANSEPASWTSGLARTRGNLARRMLSAWTENPDVEVWLRGVEETLLSSDVGIKATTLLVDRWRGEIGGAATAEEVRTVIQCGVRELLEDGVAAPSSSDKPRVVLVVGVNGVGKTTTIGKLAHHYKQEGLSVLLVAADTFRAAAIEQLQLWAERVGIDLVKHQHGADPSAVVFDGVKAARARSVDVVIIDTAGRLHVKENLMAEVQKIARTAGREIADAPHEVLLVIDATTGQNAINQAKVFHESLGVTGVALTKLDGTARGGVALAIRTELGLPIRYVGIGERIEDLAPFDAEAFAEALFSDTDLEPGATRS